MSIITLGDICEVTAGQSAPQDPSIFGVKGNPFIRAGSLEKLLNGGAEEDCELISDENAVRQRLRLFPEDTILFAKSGMSAKIGRVYRLRTPSYVVSHLAAVIPGSKVDPSYLQRWFEKHPPSRLIPNESYPSIRTSEISQLKIDLPPLAEQKRIAAILDKADTIRRKRQQAIKLADDFLRATFLDMFGDPVTNPKGWKVRLLSMLCDVRDGTHDSPKYVKDGYPLITSKNVKDGFIDFSDVSLISEEDFIQINKRSKVDIGDIIMPMIGTIGHPVIVETNRPFAIKNVALIKFKTTSINNRYILHLLRSNYFNWVIQKQNRGGTQKFIALSDIRNFPIPVPGENDLSKFDTFCRKLESLVLKKNNLGTEGKDLFNSLTQRAFRGEL